jgi:5'-3' exonuclease
MGGLDPDQTIVKGFIMQRHILKVRKRDHFRTVLLIDGKHLAYRTFFGDINVLTHNQIRTGVAYGFLNTLRSISQKFDTGDVIICWDGEGSRRREIYPAYKEKHLSAGALEAGTDPKTLAFKAAFKDGYYKLMEDMAEIGFASYILDRYEADDLIGLYVKQYPVELMVIVTADEDMYQLIDQHVIQFDTKSKIRKDLRWFRKTYDIEPIDWIMVKALGGCKSDNVKGIGGVAAETAIKIIQGTASANNMNKLNTRADQIAYNINLVRLPMPEIANYQLPDRRTNLNLEKWERYCHRMGFRKFLGDYNVQFLKFCRDLDNA